MEEEVKGPDSEDGRLDVREELEDCWEPARQEGPQEHEEPGEGEEFEGSRESGEQEGTGEEDVSTLRLDHRFQLKDMLLEGHRGEGKGTPETPEHDDEKTPTRIESLYRKFYGEVIGRHQLLFSIIWMEFTRRIKKPILILLIIMAWIATIIPFVMIIYFAQRFTPDDAFFYNTSTDEFTRNMFISSYDTAFFFLVLFAAFVGGKLFSQAFADKTIVLYLTKPISKTDFLLSRFGVVALTLSLVSLIPVMILYFSAVAMTFKSFSWFVNNFWLLAAVLGYGLLIILTFTNISLAFSCLTKRVYWAMACVIIFISLSEALGAIINGITDSDYGTLITVWDNLRVVGHVMFQLDLPYDVNWLFSLFMIAVINVICFAIVFWKVAVLETD